MTSKQTSVWEAINTQLGTSLTETDYIDWLEGGAGYDEFENKVQQILTPNEMNRAEVAARVDSLLRFKLNIGPQTSGGVDLGLLLDGGLV